MEDSNDKVYGVLAYIGLLVLVPILAGKTQFARYHANQGLALFIVNLIGGVVVGVVSGILTFVVPFVGVIVGSILGGVYGLAVLILAIIGIVHAVNGEMKPLPVIGGFNILK